MMRFHWPISNLTFFGSAENKYIQFSWVIFAHSIIQENWKIELAEPCTDPNGLCTVRPIQFFNFLEKWNKQILLNYTVCVHFQLTKKMLN